MISTTTNRNIFTGRVTRSQLEILVDAIEKNPNLNRIVSKTYTNDQWNRDWTILSAKLNKDGGALKSVGKWKKCWMDYKTEVKKRYLGKLNCKRSLSSIEERTAIFMGLDLTKSAANIPDKPPLDLEISQVESITNMPTASGEQDIANYLADPANAESMNVITLVPDESRPVTIIRVKIDPEDGDSGHGKTVAANHTPQTDTLTLLPETRSVTASTPATRFISVLQQSLVPESTPAPKETQASESSAEETSVAQFKSVPKESVSDSPIVDETTVPEFAFAPEELSDLELPPVNKKKRKKLTKRKKDSCTKDLVKVQTATADALQMVGRALETMAENQKTQLAIEERRTVLFEKLINHLCK